MKKIVNILCLFLGMFALCIMPTFAEDPIVAEINVEATSGSVIKIEALSGAPSAVSQTITVGSTGKGKFQINVIEAGTYEYKVSQVKGTDKTTKYDETVYNVTLFISTTDTQQKLQSSVYAKDASTGTKKETIKFVNKAIPPTPTPTATPTATPAPTQQVTNSSTTFTNTDAGYRSLVAGTTFITAIALIIFLKGKD